MNSVLKLVIAAAAVVVVGVAAFSLLPASGGVGGGPTPAPTASPTPSPLPTAAPSATPTAPPPAAAFPPEGPLAAGTHGATLEGVRLSFTVPGSGWTTFQGNFIGKGESEQPGDFALALWESAPENVYSDPCAHTPLSPKPSATAVGLAAAAAAIPGTDLVSGPLPVTVGGRPAQHVVFTIRDDLGCDPKNAYLWYDESSGGAIAGWHWASALGATHQVWTIDVDGKVIWIDSESFKGASPEIGQAIQQVIDSIQFE